MKKQGVGRSSGRRNEIASPFGLAMTARGPRVLVHYRPSPARAGAGTDPSAASKAGRGTHPTSRGGVSAPVSEPGRFAPISLTNQHRIHLRESSGRVRGGPPKASRWLGRPAESWSEARPEPTLRP